jgi:hypothetical protein
LNKIVLIKKTSAIFLAIVLVAGTIALSFPSFMIGAAYASSDREKDHDDNDDKEKSHGKDRDRDDKSRDHDKYDNDDKKSYGKDRDRDDKSRDHDKYDNDDKKSYGKDDRDKSKDSSSSVSIKKVKCNNINVNLNGIDVDIGLPNNGPITDPIALAQETEEDDETEANSIESDDDESYEGRDGKSDSDTNSRIVCINNNNNIVVQEEPEPPVPSVDECLLCFEETTQAVRDAINTFLDEQEEITVTDGIVIPADVNNFEDLCDWLADEAPLLLTQVQIDQLIDAFVGQTQPPIPRGDVEDLVQCLIDAGLIEVIPPEPPGQLTLCHRSANQPDQTLTGQNQNQFDAHINNHDGPPGAGPDSPGPCPT